ncbi:Serine carboxypeptidase-like 26 [Hibiscus syriacus]|uniref:Serine carboxypeptidase-like 26 n=1 Tax=Hibiscus syriacus TaxID=106335 RepID=A0A6A3C9K0_HIBSY|nr:Serine carboxypeptidase-like 26 [Hibiscus syriacus]
MGGKPGIPKTKGFHRKSDDEDFEFEFSGQLEKSSLSADELFQGGKVRPLNDFDPLETPIGKSRKGSVPVEPKQRGRDRSSACSSSSSSSYNYVHKKSRSLSPFRAPDDATFEQENPKSYVSSILSSISFSKGNWKWKLKDLLLLRSASEGRATTSNDCFRKYDVLLSKKVAEDVNNLSFRSTESVGSSSRRRGRVSAHELHYKANRAVSEEIRRKTFLPYRQSLLGCLGIHDFSRGIVSFKRP